MVNTSTPLKLEFTLAVEGSGDLPYHDSSIAADMQILNIKCGLCYGSNDRVPPLANAVSAVKPTVGIRIPGDGVIREQVDKRRSVMILDSGDVAVDKGLNLRARRHCLRIQRWTGPLSKTPVRLPSFIIDGPCKRELVRDRLPIRRVRSARNSQSSLLR
jgi:hypothetical protein